MKPQTKPFLVVVKSSRRIGRARTKPNWSEVAPSHLAEEQPESPSFDVRLEIKESD
jgi:hypothetical protein